MSLLPPLLLQVLTPSGALGCLKEGPAEGMCGDVLLSKEGDFEVWSVKPSTEAGAAMPPELARAVSGLLAAYDSHHAAYPRELLTANATQVFCATDAEVPKGCIIPKPALNWPFTTLTHNRPYLMKDGRVRIEWMEAGKLKYLSLITFDDSHMGLIRTAPASIVYKRAG